MEVIILSNNRILNIVNLLLKSDNYITIDTISKELGVSNKTIRNDLKLAEEWLKENDLRLIKKTGVGVTIAGERSSKLHTLNLIKSKNKKLIDFSPEARKIYLALRLITSTENCRVYELANELYVSRATIHKDLLSLSPILDKHKIKLNRKNNNGISITGKERNLRNLLIELMLNDNGHDTFINIIKNDAYQCDGSFVFSGIDYIDDEYKEFINLILRSGNKYINSLLFQPLVMVLLHLFVAFIRAKDHHNVNLSEEFINELKYEPFYNEAKELTDLLSNKYNIAFSEMDIRYLQVYFISLQNNRTLNSENEKEAKALTNEIISSLYEDETFKNSLYTHFYSAITRFRHGIKIENPLMTEIKTLYKNTFNIMKKTSHIIEQRYNCQVSDDEIGYLALHLACSLESMKKPLKTVVVCHGGIGASNLLVRKLSTQIPEIQIVSQETFLSIHEADLNEIELIISTIDFNFTKNIPILIINNLLFDYDITRIKDIIKSYYKKKNDPLNNIEDTIKK